MALLRTSVRLLFPVFALILTPLTLAESLEPLPQHGIAMHGEPRYPADFSHFDYVNPDAPKGGTLRRAVVANGFDSFNGFIMRGVSAQGLSSHLHDSLMTQSRDEPFSVYPLIAESLEVPPDRSWVIFNINPDARFHDGSPITADDVAFSYRILTEEGHPFFRSYYADVSDVEIINEHRIRFDFGESGNRELPLTLGQMPILSEAYWGERDFGRTTLDPPLGNGPYRIGDFRAGRSITYERVEDYWAADLPVNRGRHNFDRIQYEYFSDQTVALEAFRAGEYDFRLENTAKTWANAYSGRPFDGGEILTAEIDHEEPVGMQGFIMNSRREQFSDPRVREALSYAFDFEWTNRQMFYDQYTRTRSYFENSHLAAQGIPEGREREILEEYRGKVPDWIFERPYEPPSSDGSGFIRDNLYRAMELLNDAGYEVREGRMVNAETGESLDFEILLVQKAFERVVLPYARNLRKLGINARVRMVDTNQFVQRVRSFDFDMFVHTLSQSESPGNEQRDLWTSAAAETPGSRNFMGISDPVVDELVDKVIQAPDLDELQAYTRALDRVLLSGHYVVPNWHLDHVRIAWRKHLKRPDTVPASGLELDTWWVEE